MIHIKLGEPTVASSSDPMGREWHGFNPEASLQELFDNNRGRWVLGQRADREQYAVFSYIGDHTVKFVAAIDGLEEFDGRRAIIGRVLGSDDPFAARWVGQPSPDRFRNPTTYHPDDDGPLTCACGCGESVKAGRTFAPGHDQRAIHERIEEQWGGTLGFIRWYDATHRSA